MLISYLLHRTRVVLATAVAVHVCVLQLQGLSYDETRAVRKENLNPGILTYYKNPVLIHQVIVLAIHDCSVSEMCH